MGGLVPVKGLQLEKIKTCLKMKMKKINQDKEVCLQIDGIIYLIFLILILSLDEIRIYFFINMY
jgi:hypothetical protein